MIVHCPHCLTGYVLPDRLVGDGGARVRCPGCEEVFVVLPEAQGEEPRSGTAGSAGGSTGAGAGVTPDPPVAAPVGEAPATMPMDDAPAPAPAGEAQSEDPAAVAGDVLGVLADFLGEDLSRSRNRGTVLSDHGPAILAGWDEYRRRIGADAPSHVFRAVLRERCGVDLTRADGG